VTRRSLLTVSHMVAMIAILIIGFVLLEERFRLLEVGMTARLLGLLGISDRVVPVRNALLVEPFSGPFFAAVLAPSCSALAPALAVACLGSVTPPRPWRRRLVATVTAVSAVIVGNLVRITSALLAGLLTGSSSLVLFHDIVGSFFGFVYILAGYLLLLYLLLPAAEVAPIPRGVDLRVGA
jgi:exosortase/archaeosortase family protein